LRLIALKYELITDSLGAIAKTLLDNLLKQKAFQEIEREAETQRLKSLESEILSYLQPIELFVNLYSLMYLAIACDWAVLLCDRC
jgi:hypothetical protein